jgi:hypothetical protein
VTLHDGGFSALGVIRGGLVSDGRLIINDATGAAKAAQNTDMTIRRVMQAPVLNIMTTKLFGLLCKTKVNCTVHFIHLSDRHRRVD